MTVCECGKKFVSPKVFEAHKIKIHGILPEEEVPQPSPEPEKIVLHFSRNVEVYINGRAFVGKDVEVPDYSVAAEVARIARDAYGSDVLL